MKYRPFKPILKDSIEPERKKSWLQRAWNEKMILTQIFVRITYLFSSYSLVFILALFIAVEVFRRSLTIKITETIELQGIEGIERNMQLCIRQGQFMLDILNQLISKESIFIMDALGPDKNYNGIHPVQWSLWAGWSLG